MDEFGDYLVESSRVLFPGFLISSYIRPMAVSPLVFPRRRRVFELSLWAFLGHLPATPHVQGIFHFFISKRSVSDTWAFHMCKASLRHASLGARFGASGDSADLWWGPARTSPARGGFPFLTVLARQSGSSKWPG